MSGHINRFSPFYEQPGSRRPVDTRAMPSYEQPIERRGKTWVQLTPRQQRAVWHKVRATHTPRFAEPDQREVHTPEWRSDLTTVPSVPEHRVGINFGARQRAFY